MNAIELDVFKDTLRHYGLLKVAGPMDVVKNIFRRAAPMAQRAEQGGVSAAKTLTRPVAQAAQANPAYAKTIASGPPAMTARAPAPTSSWGSKNTNPQDFSASRPGAQAQAMGNHATVPGGGGQVNPAPAAAPKKDYLVRPMDNQIVPVSQAGGSLHDPNSMAGELHDLASGTRTPEVGALPGTGMHPRAEAHLMHMTMLGGRNVGQAAYSHPAIQAARQETARRGFIPQAIAPKVAEFIEKYAAYLETLDETLGPKESVARAMRANVIASLGRP